MTQKKNELVGGPTLYRGNPHIFSKRLEVLFLVPKTNSKFAPAKMARWKTFFGFLLGTPASWQVRTVSFRECISSFFSKGKVGYPWECTLAVVPPILPHIALYNHYFRECSISSFFVATWVPQATLLTKKMSCHEARYTFGIKGAMKTKTGCLGVFRGMIWGLQ